MKPDVWRRVRPHLLALSLYLALTVLALDNLVLHLATAVPATDGLDYGIFYWNFWWVKYALFNLHRDPFFSDYVLHPNTVNLALHTLTLPLGLLTAPLQDLVDLKLLFNGVMVGSFVAAAYFTFLLLRRRVQANWLALVGGALFAFTPATISHAQFSHVNLLQAWWLPVQLLLWEYLAANIRMRWRVMAAAGLGLALYLAWLTDVQILLWALPLLAPYALYTWIARCQGRERLRVLMLAVAAGLFMLAPALVEPIPALLQTRDMEFSRVGLGTAEYYSYQPAWLVDFQAVAPTESIGRVLPFLALFSLPLLGRRRERWLWLALGVGLLVLALGPYWPGTRIPLPYLIVHKLLGEEYRSPERFSTPATLALILFVALSWADRFKRPRVWGWRSWAAAPLLGALLGALVLDGGLLQSFPVSFIPDYQIYHEIGRDPQEYALLEIPVSPASGFAEFGQAPDLQFYAYIHHKQLVNGIVSRLPTDGLDRFLRSPLLHGLTGLEDLPPFDEASTELADKLDHWNLRYVLVHGDRLEPERARAIIQFLNMQPELCLVDQERDLLAYRHIADWSECPEPGASALPDGTTRLQLGEPGDERYVGTGWYDHENIGGPQGRWAGEISTSTLRVLLPWQTIRVSFNALAYPVDQTVEVVVNGRPLAHFQLTDTWQVYQFDIPANLIPAAGPTTLELRHTRLLSASERTKGEIADDRPLSAAYTWFDFTLLPPH